MKWGRYIMWVVLLWITLFLLAYGSRNLWAAREIIIPFIPDIASMEPADRAILEDLFAQPLEDAIRHGVVQPGDRIDLDKPAVAFVLAFNRWVKKRGELLEKFGNTAYQEAMNYEEIMAWEKLRDAFKRFEKAHERERGQ